MKLYRYPKLTRALNMYSCCFASKPLNRYYLVAVQTYLLTKANQQRSHI